MNKIRINFSFCIKSFPQFLWLRHWSSMFAKYLISNDEKSVLRLIPGDPSSSSTYLIMWYEISEEYQKQATECLWRCVGRIT